jgi:hypothetical protein
MPPDIDYDSLELAMSSGDADGAFYFDTVTGQVHPISDYERSTAASFLVLDEIEDPVLRLAWCEMWEEGSVGEAVGEDDEAAVQQAVDDYLARFLIVPSMSSSEAYADMEDFAALVEDDLLHDLFARALHGPGAFRRFKDVLVSYPEERQKWFDFRDRRMHQRVRAWLAEKGIIEEE